MEKREEQVQIAVDLQKIETMTSDLVNFEQHNGYVIINFLQTYPNGLPLSPGEDPSKRPERMAKIVSRVQLSWDHFTSLIPVMIMQAENGRNVAEINIHDAVKNLDQFKDKING